jgi:delta1-piperideine-2-carboxylate reductase
MHISISEAQSLVEACMRAVGYDSAEAKIIADHLIGCELRGVPTGGFSRALSVVERVLTMGLAREPITLVRETAVSAFLDGRDHVGYVVSHKATQMAIGKAKASGIGIVGVNNTWYPGMLVHYIEMATAAGLMAMSTCSSAPRVAPYGSYEGRFGTNPLAFGFPTQGDPLIHDIGTSHGSTRRLCASG